MTTKVGNSGFTLLEVLVAITILGISTGLIMTLFGGGLKSAKLADSYSEAILLAREKLDENMSNGEEIETASGSDGLFIWEKDISPFTAVLEESEGFFPDFNKVTVKVSWFEGSKEKVVSLQTIVIAEETDRENDVEDSFQQ